MVSCGTTKWNRNNAASPGETFGGRESQSLKDLGLHPNATLLLEVRSPDQKFEEFDPSDLHVFLARCSVAEKQNKTSSVLRALTGV